MSSTWELKEKSTGELITTLEGEAWKEAQKKAFSKLAKSVNLPGFRKGHAPASLVKKQIGTQRILFEAIDFVANDALAAAVEEQKLELVDNPSLDLESIDEEKVVFKFICTVKPEVTLGQYTGLEIKKEEVTVSDEDVEAELVKLQERYADLVVKEEGKVENGDTAVIDFEGFKDGIPFEGGKADNYPLVIGSGSFIPGFEEQVLGMGIEESKDINVSFPENYHVDELAGAPVVFKVTVHEIKSKVLPELDDELVKKAKVENVETVDAYKEYAKNNLVASRENSANQEFENNLLTAICDNATVDIPQVMIEKEIDALVNDFAQRLQSQGFSVDQFKQMTGQSDEMIREEMGKDAEAKVKVRLVLETIVEKEAIEVNDEEIEQEYANVAAAYGLEVAQAKQYLPKDYIENDLKIRKALDFVKENVAK